MASTPPSSASEASSLFFGDARACKAWLNSLAVSNVAQTQSAVLDALRVFNRAAFAPLERLKCLELLRDRVSFMLGEQRTRQFSKPLPISAQDGAAWSAGRMVLEEMEAGYRRCLAEPELEAHFAIITHRTIRYIGAQMLLHAIVYRRFDPALWMRLHQQFAGAEKAGLASERVKDSLDSEGGVSNVTEAYAQAVLQQAAGLHEMSPPQVQFAEALLKLWGRKVKVLDHAPAESTASILPLVVDLARAQGAEPRPRDALGASHRVLDVEGLSRSIRRRIRALQSGEDVATLGLPAAATGVDPLNALQRLAKRWCEPASPEPAGQAPAEAVAGLVFGLASSHFFLSGGKSFEQPDKERELTSQEKQDIEVFGRVTERTQSMMAPAGQSYTVEPWDAIEEAPGALRLRRRPSAIKGAAVGRLVAVRRGDSAPFHLGMVRALFNEDDGLVMALTIFPGQPEPIAVRSGNAPWTQGLALPAIEKLGVAASIVVPGAMAFRGRTVQFWADGARELKVQDILERGADFDRVTVS